MRSPLIEFDATPNRCQNDGMDAHTLTHAVKTEAHHLGFDLCRITPITPDQAAPHADFFEEWIGLGRAGEMGYLAQHGEKRRFPARCWRMTVTAFAP